MRRSQSDARDDTLKARTGYRTDRSRCDAVLSARLCACAAVRDMSPQKIKRKVGKKAPVKANVTNTSFATKCQSERERT